MRAEKVKFKPNKTKVPMVDDSIDHGESSGRPMQRCFLNVVVA